MKIHFSALYAALSTVITAQSPDSQEALHPDVPDVHPSGHISAGMAVSECAKDCAVILTKETRTGSMSSLYCLDICKSVEELERKPARVDSAYAIPVARKLPLIDIHSDHTGPTRKVYDQEKFIGRQIKKSLESMTRPELDELIRELWNTDRADEKLEVEGSKRVKEHLELVKSLYSAYLTPGMEGAEVRNLDEEDTTQTLVSRGGLWKEALARHPRIQ